MNQDSHVEGERQTEPRTRGFPGTHTATTSNSRYQTQAGTVTGTWYPGYGYPCAAGRRNTGMNMSSASGYAHILIPGHVKSSPQLQFPVFEFTILRT
eukprot:122040-Rhodomonas_salina.1